jgi:uncharacterized protein YecE (DUF72 family)
MHPITIGTCGWSYKEWAGPFYPKGAAPAGFLSHYAEHFSMVEVDSTYYATPSRRTVEGWRAKTPEHFRFSLKVPQIITHEKVLLGCEADRDAFLKAAQLLGDKLHCCLLQFGYFNKSTFAEQGEFLTRLNAFLTEWPSGVPLCVEVRNKSWMNARLAEVLRKHEVVWVLPDQAWMPSPLDVVEKLDAVTGPFAYVRLLGDRAAVDALTETLDHIVVDRGDELQRTAQAISRLADRVPVLAFVNNHYAGYAIETARQLQAAIDELQQA